MELFGGNIRAAAEQANVAEGEFGVVFIEISGVKLQPITNFRTYAELAERLGIAGATAIGDIGGEGEFDLIE